MNCLVKQSPSNRLAVLLHEKIEHIFNTGFGYFMSFNWIMYLFPLENELPWEKSCLTWTLLFPRQGLAWNKPFSFAVYHLDFTGSITSAVLHCGGPGLHRYWGAFLAFTPKCWPIPSWDVTNKNVSRNFQRSTEGWSEPPLPENPWLLVWVVIREYVFFHKWLSMQSFRFYVGLS